MDSPERLGRSDHHLPTCAEEDCDRIEPGTMGWRQRSDPMAKICVWLWTDISRSHRATLIGCRSFRFLRSTWHQELPTCAISSCRWQLYFSSLRRRPLSLKNGATVASWEARAFRPTSLGRHAFPANSVERGALAIERGSMAAMTDMATAPLAGITAPMATDPSMVTAVIPAIGS